MRDFYNLTPCFACGEYPCIVQRPAQDTWDAFCDWPFCNENPSPSVSTENGAEAARILWNGLMATKPPRSGTLKTL